MRLFYFLRFDTPEYDKMGIEWENAAQKYVEQNWVNNSLLEVSTLKSRLLETFDFLGPREALAKLRRRPDE